jgi:hypothetical protein
MSSHTTIARRTRALAGASTLALIGSLGLMAPAYADDTTPAAPTAPTAPSTPVAKGDGTTGCTTGKLPDTVTGKPAAFKAGLSRGYWIWHDTAGWHLRVTHTGGQKTVFSGTVRTSNKATSHKVLTERHDRIVRSADRRTTTFRFTNYGKVDGLDFRAGCSATVAFTLLVDGKAISPDRIHLGKADSHPAAAAFTITRVPTPV